MKVITLISGGDAGGAKTHVLSLLRELNKHIYAHLVCFREGDFADDARAFGIPTTTIAAENPFKTVSMLKKIIRDGSYDLVHCHGARGNFLGSLLKRSLEIPVITTVHSDYRLDYMGRPLARVTYGILNSIALRRLDYRIGVSDAMPDLLIDRGFDPSGLFAIYNGIDFDYKPDIIPPSEFFEGLGLDIGEDEIVIGIAARLNPIKDIETLIRAFAIALGFCPNLRLLIAGDGEDKARLISLSKALGVAERTHFIGWTKDADSFLNALDINTLTSIFETFPYSLTEGARMKKPTVSSKVGGIPRLIDHGVSGMLFDAGDHKALAACLVTLAQNPETRRKMGERLYNKAKTEFSLDKTASRQLEIYNKIIGLYRRKSEKKARHERDGVIICGAYGHGNAGDDAILEAIIQQLRDIDEDMPIHVLSRNPKETRKKYKVPAIFTFNFPTYISLFRRSKLYLNGGGSLIQDVTSRRSLWFYLSTISAAKRCGNRVIMYGCGIGPVNHSHSRRLVAKVLNSSVDIITLRDPRSRDELQELAVTKPEIILSADPSLVLKAAKPEKIDSAMISAGMPPLGEYICFGLRKWPGFNKKADCFARAAEYAYDKYGLTPVFLPIDLANDTHAARQVVKRLSVPCHIISTLHSSDVTIGILSRMRAVISMRLHGLVFSASQGIPLVGVVYDPKVSSFLSYIGQELFIELEDVESDLLCGYVDKAMQQADDKERLAARHNLLLSLEKENVNALKRLLEDV